MRGAWIKYISYELIKSDASASFKDKHFVKKGVGHDGRAGRQLRELSEN